MATDAYESLIQWLEKSWYGVAESEHLRLLLKSFYSPEEAELLTGFPYKDTSLEELPASNNTDASTLVQKLDELARKGMLYRSERDGQVRYRLNDAFFMFYRSAFWPGRDDERFKAAAHHMNKYHGDGFMDRFAHAHEKGLRVIPIEKTMADTREILCYEDVVRFVDTQDYCTVSNCACRMRDKLDKNGNGCNHPMEVCLHFGKLGHYIVENGLGREITKEEAKEVLKKCADSGLVHAISNHEEGADTICNCCACHCMFINSYHQLRHARGLSPSNFVVQVVLETCKACGLCTKRCPMDALQLKFSPVTTNKVRKAAVVDPAACIGCGVCVHKCPTASLTLVHRQEIHDPPKTLRDWGKSFFNDRETGPKLRKEQ